MQILYTFVQGKLPSERNPTVFVVRNTKLYKIRKL
jgi:hypothetical protein